MFPLRWLTVVAATHCLLSAAAAAEPVSSAEAQGGPVQALWKEQEITFFFQSVTSFYSCDGLEDKLKKILTALGARGKVKVDSFGCESGPVRTPRVAVKLSAPIEATPEAVAEHAKTRSQRELRAKVKGDSPPASDLDAQFAAQWRNVSLSRGDLGLEPGDCELIDELRRKLLPKLAVRIVRNEIRCTPNRLTPGQPQLEVQALVEAPNARPGVRRSKLTMLILRHRH